MVGLKQLFVKGLSRPAFFNCFHALHRFGMAGMGYGVAGFLPVTETGEKGALEYALSRLEALRPLTVFDVGANKGDWTSMALEVIGSRPFSALCIRAVTNIRKLA